MNFQYNQRVTTAIVIFVTVVMLLMLYSALTSRIKLKNFHNTPIQRYTTRFEVLKKSLPPSSFYGYISDTGNNISLTQPNTVAEFYITQYALAPFLIDNSIKTKYIIGNFHKNPIYQILHNKLTVVKYFGDGVFLLTHNKK